MLGVLILLLPILAPAALLLWASKRSKDVYVENPKDPVPLWRYRKKK